MSKLLYIDVVLSVYMFVQKKKKIADYFANIVIIFQYQIISATYSDSKGKFNPNTLVV